MADRRTWGTSAAFGIKVRACQCVCSAISNMVCWLGSFHNWMLGMSTLNFHYFFPVSFETVSNLRSDPVKSLIQQLCASEFAFTVRGSVHLISV